MRDARRSPAAGEHRCAHAPAYAYSTPRPPRSQPRRCAPSNPCAAAVPSSTCSAARHTADVRASAARPVLAHCSRRPRPSSTTARQSTASSPFSAAHAETPRAGHGAGTHRPRERFGLILPSCRRKPFSLPLFFLATASKQL
ncbi:hypothetical protein SEVIR_4G038750v4 [Setaria viridis]